MTMRVGKALGAAEPGQARVTFSVGQVLVVVWIALPALVLLTWPDEWGRIFTPDASVLSLLDVLVYLLVLYHGIDCLLSAYSAMLAGCGRQSIGGRLALLGYVAVGLPTALALAFPAGYGAVGLLAGHTLGKAVHAGTSAFAAELRTAT